MMKSVGFLLFPRFQLLAYVLATETLRLANKTAAKPVYHWCSFCPGDLPVHASNGIRIDPDGKIGSAGKPDLLILCAGYDPLSTLDRQMSGWLRQLARNGCMLGGFDTGSVILAELGLLKDHKAVIHWEALEGFQENYPDIDTVDAIYSLDRHRLTAAGGLSAADAMVAWIASDRGNDAAAAVSADMVQGSLRPGGTPQRLSTAIDPLHVSIEELMRENLEEPLSIDELANRFTLSTRQLSRLFDRWVGIPPSQRYLALRLERGRHLLAATRMPVREIALACGFSSGATFGRAYRARYGMAPLPHRRLLQSRRGAGIHELES